MIPLGTSEFPWLSLGPQGPPGSPWVPVGPGSFWLPWLPLAPPGSSCFLLALRAPFGSLAPPGFLAPQGFSWLLLAFPSKCRGGQEAAAAQTPSPAPLAVCSGGAKRGQGEPGGAGLIGGGRARGSPGGARGRQKPDPISYLAASNGRMQTSSPLY